MLSSDIAQDNKLSSFIEAVQNGKKLTEENWLQILGITEKQLKNILEPIAEHILNLFCYLNSGHVLKNASSKQIGNVVPFDVVDTFKAGQKPDTLTLLKLLIVIIEQFQTNKFFFCNPLLAYRTILIKKQPLG